MSTHNSEILNELYEQATKGNPQALDELSKDALGGNAEARRLIFELEKKEIPIIPITNKPKSKSGFLQVVLHPIESLKVKGRQILVGCEMAQAPVESTIEEFPDLGIAEAAVLLRSNKMGSGVPLEAWTPGDRGRLIHGQKPIGHPEHPNV